MQLLLSEFCRVTRIRKRNLITKIAETTHFDLELKIARADANRTDILFTAEEREILLNLFPLPASLVQVIREAQVYRTYS